VDGFSECDWEEIKSLPHFDLGMLLERVHQDILWYLYDNLPQDESDMGGVSRKILFKSVNFKPRLIEKACEDLESKGLVRLHSGFYKSEWTSISITDEGEDNIDDADGV